ncbi:MAG TPA: DUF2914 domain-containing protein [Candidatus Thioglobus sp.]|jgi:hypothetical protein|nr:DUF2914 domain-containing protein [Candidatus Thioglobus sp.]
MKKIAIAVLGFFLTFSVLAHDWPHENISEAVFALNVEDRVPIDIIEELDNSLGKIYFFTNIRNLKGEHITHRWIYDEKVMADVRFEIRGPRWRVWSSKNLWHTWIGEWRVQVLLDDATVLFEQTFNYKHQELTENE